LRSEQLLAIHSSEDIMSTDRMKPPVRSVPRRAPRALRHWLAAAPAALAALLAHTPAHAIECLPMSQPLVKIPEIVSQNGVLRGTLMLQDVQLRMIFRIPSLNGNAVPPGTPGAINQCLGQTVRGFRSLDAVPRVTTGPYSDETYADPVPGPTLRAKVGDIVELTFVNQLDPNRFGASRENGVQDTVQGCDIVNVGQGGTAGYPYKSLNPPVLGDSYPDCFHGSSIGNIHFHGSHTNTNGTADNVFLELQPSPRVGNQPTIGPDTYKAQFDTFFQACEQQLRANALAEWPSNWYGPNDPQHPGGSPLGPWYQSGTWLATQMSLLDPADQAANTKVAEAGQWPQYYIGAYPYCFQIPQYPYAAFPPPPGGIHMGQSPGTHWYHAHKHGSTAIDVANGMVGAFIIEGQYDKDLDTFYGDGWTRSQPVLVLNQLGVQPNLKRSGGGGAGQNDKGPDLSVNGRQQPIVDMLPGEVQLWRIVNGSGRSGAFIKQFPPQFNFRQIAQDGVQFADPNYQNNLNQSLLLASGNRADILVQAPLIPGIYPLMVQHEVDPSDLASAIPVVLLQIRVLERPPVTGNRSQFIKTAPPQPPFLADITDQEVGSTLANPRPIKFGTANGPPYAVHTINGAKFQDNQQPVAVTLNTAEQWKVMNYTFGPPISHPFHIHLNPFQIVEVFDPNATVFNRDLRKNVPKYVPKDIADNDPTFNDAIQCKLDLANEDTWRDCHNIITGPFVWWDVFPIPTGAKFKDAAGKEIPVPGYFMMRSRFVDFPGQYVIHCHILAHEDRGMMAVVDLQPAAAKKPMLMTHH
jgi:FtsP/CotA-like multicopper oxidase with cupredoxin domain